MNKLVFSSVLLVSTLSGCASVPMASSDLSNKIKQFDKPASDMAGIYVYRKDTPVGAALKKDVWINGECLGQTAKGVFFYREVEGNKKHTIATESEFSPNKLTLNTKSGSLYFIEQYMKMGVFVGGSDLEQDDIDTGMEEVSKLSLAQEGNCDSKYS